MGTHIDAQVTFVVDTSNTKKLLEKHRDAIREKRLLVLSHANVRPFF